MQAAFRRKPHASRLRDRHEIAKMPQLHSFSFYISQAYQINLTKSFSAPLEGTIYHPNGGTSRED
jgi:hypothetical protein